MSEEEKINLDEEDYPYPKWCWALLIAMLAINFLRWSILVFLWLSIFFYCKDFFEGWALEIKEKPVKPFVIVSIFGLPGQLGYYLYYKSKKEETK